MIGHQLHIPIEAKLFDLLNQFLVTMEVKAIRLNQTGLNKLLVGVDDLINQYIPADDKQEELTIQLLKTYKDLINELVNQD